MLPALVLTAGLGTRLDPITRLVAKAAVPLGRRTLVERVLGWLVAQQVTDVVLNLHHRPESITSIVGDGAHLGLRVRYSWEMPLLGSAGGPRHALPLLDANTFLVVNGDTLCDLAVAPLIEQHRSSGALVTLAVVPNPAPDRYNGIEIGVDERVVRFVPRGHAGPSWHFTGVQVVQRAVFEGLPDGVPAESVHGVYPALLGTGAGGIFAYRADAPFWDVGTPRDYLAATLALARDTAVDQGAAVAAGARITDSILWPGTIVGPRATLDECIVLGVSVPSDFEARRAVLVPASICQPRDEAQLDSGIACFQIDQ